MAQPSTGFPPPFVVPAPVPAEMARPDLTQALDTDARIMVLTGASGVGKTVALAQWAREQRRTPLWLTLTQDDQDPTVLTGKLVGASRHAGLALPTLDALPATASREEQLQAWLQDTNSRPGDGLALIVDRGEHLRPVGVELLLGLAGALGDRHVVRVSQSAPGIPANTEGAVVLHVGNDPFTPAPSGEKEALAAALRRLDPAWQEALERLSVLPEWTDAVADQGGISRPFRWTDLRGRGLAVSTHPDGEGVSPHETLLAALERRARTREDWPAIAQAGAQQAERRGEPYRAIELYADAGAFAQAARVARGLTDPWERHADWLLARETLDRIGEAHLCAPQRALLALALTETGDPERGALLARAVNAEAPQTTAFFALAMQAYRRGEVEDFGRLVLEGRAVGTRQRDLVQMDRTRAIYHHMRREPEAAVREAQGAVARAQAMNDRALQLSALSVLAFVQEDALPVEESIRTYESIMAACASLGYAHRAMPTFAQLWVLYLGARRLEDARQLADQAEGMFARYPLGEGHLLFLRGALAACGRDLDGAADLYGRGVALVIREANPLLALDRLVEYAALTLYTRNDRAALEDVLALLDGHADQGSGRRNFITAELLLKAHAAGRTGWEAVLDGAGDALGWLGEQGRGPDFTLAFLQARAALATGQLGGHHSRTMLAGLDVWPADRLLLNLLPAWRDAVTGAFLRRGWQVPEWTAVLAGLDEDARPARPLLELRTLGGAAVSVAGAALPLPARQLQLLAFVALHGPVTPDQVAAALWEDRDPARARASAQVTRSSLNAAAPTPLIVSAGDRRTPHWTLSPDVQLRVDVLDLLAEKDARAARARATGPFLPGMDADWAAEVRARIVTHLTRLYREAAAGSGPAEHLGWLQDAALLTQDPHDFEMVARHAEELGFPAEAVAARLALGQLQRGELATLPARRNG